MFNWLFGTKKTPTPAIHREGDGHHEHDIVGESFYMDAIRSIIGPVEETDEWIKAETVAVLVPVSNNVHDKNAVEIHIDGKHVGHLDRESAKIYREAAGSTVISADALIVGKWTPEGGNFGVKLDIA
jgi:hypothetical protein